MRGGFFAILFFTAFTARADLTFEPRLESFYGSEAELSQRLLFKSKINWGRGPFLFFIDGFAELENNQYQSELRRSPSQGYLQEGYVELKGDMLFFRVGRQALRWSETWTVPSLDIWTGRKWNRLFFDPLSEQLNHPTGAALTLVKNAFALDLAVINELAENDLPQPLPESSVENKLNYGARMKWTWGDVGLSTMLAQISSKQYYGISGNFAFDEVVPKFELGSRHDNEAQLKSGEDQSFITLGCDVFVGEIIFMPQMSFYELASAEGKKNQVTFYGSLQWTPNKHDVLLQAFQNIANEDTFLSATYGYSLTDNTKVSAVLQNYGGSQGLYRVYRDLTGGGLVVGARFEYSGNLIF